MVGLVWRGMIDAYIYTHPHGPLYMYAGDGAPYSAHRAPHTVMRSAWSSAAYAPSDISQCQLRGRR